MPAIQFQLTGAAARTLTTANLQLGPGRLKAVSVAIQSTNNSPADNFIRILIEEQDIATPTWRHLILQGYIGTDSGTSWTGDYPLSNDAQITAELMSNSLATAIISITTEQ